MWLLFVPILACIVLLLVMGSLVAGAFWVVGSTWPWLLIALGAWMFWHEDGRHSRRRQHGPAWTSTPRRTRPQSPRQTVAAPKRSPSEPKPELPIDVQVKVEQIRRKVDVLLGFADRFPPFSRDLYLVRQTASDYLPRTIDAFMALPSERTDKPLSAEGKTAREELKAQLDL